MRNKCVSGWAVWTYCFPCSNNCVKHNLFCREVEAVTKGVLCFLLSCYFLFLLYFTRAANCDRLSVIPTDFMQFSLCHVSNEICHTKIINTNIIQTYLNWNKLYRQIKVLGRTEKLWKFLLFVRSFCLTDNFNHCSCHYCKITSCSCVQDSSLLSQAISELTYTLNETSGFFKLIDKMLLSI